MTKWEMTKKFIKHLYGTEGMDTENVFMYNLLIWGATIGVLLPLLLLYLVWGYHIFTWAWAGDWWSIVHLWFWVAIPTVIFIAWNRHLAAAQAEMQQSADERLERQQTRHLEERQRQRRGY